MAELRYDNYVLQMYYAPISEHVERRAGLFGERHPEKRHAGRRASKVPFGPHLNILRRLAAAVRASEGLDVGVYTHQPAFHVGEIRARGRPLSGNRQPIHSEKSTSQAGRRRSVRPTFLYGRGNRQNDKRMEIIFRR